MAEVPTSVATAFRRVRTVRTFKTLLVALAALGFGLVTGPVLANLYLDERFHLGTFGRGLVGSVTVVGVLVVVPFVGRHYDDRYRHDPAQALRLLGLLVVPVGILLPIQYAMPNPTLFAIVGAVPTVLMITALALVTPILQSVVPYRLRGLGLALGAVYVFGIGATGGALLAAGLTNGLGPRGAVLVVGIPSMLVGGLLVLRGADTIKGDLSRVVAELREELAEVQRQQEDPDTVPALQVTGIDYAYGHVQVLFDVSFEVRRGEVLALLGTNGAGKSTILRVIAGLGTPSRGVVRLGGTTVTYVAPEQRVRLGIRLLPGGKGVFPQMTVRENLEMGAYVYRHDSADRERRIARVLGLFADLANRQGQVAASMSGGQQQMLALAIDPAARPRGAADRRALAGAVAHRGPGADRHHRAAEGRGQDHRDRRAVAQRGPGPGRSSRVHGEGPGPVRGVGPGAGRARRPGPGRVPGAGRRMTAVSATPCWPPWSRPR